jgi:hypothetical protein
VGGSSTFERFRNCFETEKTALGVAAAETSGTDHFGHSEVTATVAPSVGMDKMSRLNVVSTDRGAANCTQQVSLEKLAWE